MAEQPRPRRRTRGALRALLVETGVDLLLEDGLGEGGDNLTFGRVFERLEEHDGIRITHASVLGRIWANQKEFQRDVLVELAGGDRNAYADTIDRMGPELDAVDLGSLEGRWAGARELARVASELVLDANTSSPVWRAWMAVWSLGPGTVDPAGEPDEAVAEALRRGYHEVNASSTEMHSALAAFLGFRLRPPMTIERYTTIVTALTEGCSVRDLLGTELSRGIRRPTGPDGELQDWTVYGLAIFTLFRDFYEPDPDFVLPPTVDAGSSGPPAEDPGGGGSDR